MANFVADLWDSVFTPGPTTPLLIATNAAFGALQLVFLALLFLTYSVHFVILSFLCGGLWLGINWFAAEVRVAQAEEDEKQARERERNERSEDGVALDEDVGADADDDTEVEGGGTATIRPTERVRVQPVGGTTGATGAAAMHEGEEEEMTTPTMTSNFTSTNAKSSDGGAAWNTSTAARLAPAGTDTTLRKRRDMADSTELSTDSEWEKVEGEQ